ncbi:hypothetical protein [Haloplanus rubicundus]|uniref:hypothetical protein n=1 Tax=Haloplanus rubicundus TaxID=1547898 RepID=UPI001300AB94|nr:hypothetical protein [Haloplanus rubicundus]
MESAEATMVCGENVQNSGWDEGAWATDDFEDRMVEEGIVGADVRGLDAGDG